MTRRRSHSVTDGPDRMVEVDGVAHRVSRDRGGVVRAPAPALVVAITVAAGDEVEAGSTVAVLEAMKMEMTVVATHGGRVREVLAAASTHVDAGAPLLVVEPQTVGDVTAPDAPRIGFGAATAASEPGTRRSRPRASRRPAQPDHGLRRERGGGPSTGPRLRAGPGRAARRRSRAAARRARDPHDLRRPGRALPQLAGGGARGPRRGRRRTGPQPP